jgi:hypothetical protein
VVATAVGPQRLLAKAGGGNEIGAAADLVKVDLRVFVPQASNVIHITFQHSDFELVRPVLSK